SGKLIGINSFKESGEGLNFAVALSEISAFLNLTSAQTPSLSRSCKPTRLYQGRNQENSGALTQIDSNCDGKADISVLLPDDTSKTRVAHIVSNFDGKIDIVVDDNDRDGKWDISFHDVDFDGTIDLVGYHPDGKLTPSRYETYPTYVARMNVAGR